MIPRFGTARHAFSRALLIAHPRLRASGHCGRGRICPATRRCRRPDASSCRSMISRRCRRSRSRPRTNSATAWSPTAGRWSATCWPARARQARAGPLHRGERLLRRHPDRGLRRLRRDPRDGGQRREAVAAREGAALADVSDLGSCRAARPGLPAPADLAGGQDRSRCDPRHAPDPPLPGHRGAAGHGGVRRGRLLHHPQGRREPAGDQPGQYPVVGLADGDRAAALPAEPRRAAERRRRPRRSTPCTSASTSSGAGSS